jgi:hypothetical protein
MEDEEYEYRALLKPLTLHHYYQPPSQNSLSPNSNYLEEEPSSRARIVLEAGRGGCGSPLSAINSKLLSRAFLIGTKSLSPAPGLESPLIRIKSLQEDNPSLEI